MTLEKTQLKFAKSPETGELIGFISRHPKKQNLMGVYENSHFGKKICVLSEELKGTIIPNKLYLVEMKPMHSGNGYVVVKATRKLFPTQVETIIIPKVVYKVQVTFGYKTIFFDPKDGNSKASSTLAGAIKALRERDDIENLELVIEDLTRQAQQLVKRMLADGYIVPDNTLR